MTTTNLYNFMTRVSKVTLRPNYKPPSVEDMVATSRTDAELAVLRTLQSAADHLASFIENFSDTQGTCRKVHRQLTFAVAS